MLTLGQWLRQKRSQRGLTQAQLAQRLSCEGASISRWENEKNSPSLEQFRAVCLVLEASADEALGLPVRRRPIESRNVGVGANDPARS